MLRKYMKFIGPGLMVSVAYMDPGNYSTAVAAGSAYQYKLLFSIFLLNCLAIFLQILLAKLGAVTGLDLAANCRQNLPHRVNIAMYVLAEIAIIATDLAEVVGTAIALNILFKLPLFAGVIVTVVDVLVVLMAYRPNGPLVFIRVFEGFVSVLVAATVVCFGIELFQVSKDPDFSAAAVMRGFLPSAAVVDMSEREGGNGLFLSLAILGATVMPHLLYLGSGLVQARLKDYDIKHGFYSPARDDGYAPVMPDSAGSKTVTVYPDEDTTQTETEREDIDEDTSGSTLGKKRLKAGGKTTIGSGDGMDTGASSASTQTNTTALHTETAKDPYAELPYRPSIHAINDTMTYTIVELVVSLFTVALFVNATILIVAGATTGSDDPDDAGSDSDSDSEGSTSGDLYTIYALLSTHLLPTAGFVFALALLCLGQSAGVVCTLAGQMVLEGFLLWSLLPVVRRLVTRGLAIAPCLVVVTVAGREGLARTLNALQVVLAVLLPVVTAPLIMFTCSKTIMRVPIMLRHLDVYDEPDAATGSTVYLPARFAATEPAIRLQTLKNAHPCGGWESDDDAQHALGHVGSDHVSDEDTDRANTEEEEEEVDDDDATFITGHRDMSNGPVMTVLAIVVWGFVAGLNVFLLGSMLLGYDVPM